MSTDYPDYPATVDPWDEIVNLHGKLAEAQADAERLRAALGMRGASVASPPAMPMSDGTPSPMELWAEAKGDRSRYRQLLIDHGLLIPLKPGEKAEPLPCGWPHRRTSAVIDPDEEANDG
jgi:hypothetical protein